MVDELRGIFESKNGVRIVEFDRKEAWVGEKHKLRNPHYYVAHEPDIVLSDGDRLGDRVFVEYVNSKRHFLFDLRGMLALSTVVRERRGFILAVRDSVFRDGIALVGIHRDSNLSIMSLGSLLHL